jgi:hypothetical protein
VIPAFGLWRIVTLHFRVPPAGTELLRPAVRADLDIITAWGLRAPVVHQRVPGEAVTSTLGEPTFLVPLIGNPPHELASGARIFAIVPPEDTRSDAALLQAADDSIRIADERGAP